MSDTVPVSRMVVAMRPIQCTGDISHMSLDILHVSLVKLADGAVLAADDLVVLIDAGMKYFMKAPNGMRIVTSDGAEFEASDTSLILQVRVCDGCGKRVPFA